MVLPPHCGMGSVLWHSLDVDCLARRTSFGADRSVI
jgi:hypothetical protein